MSEVIVNVDSLVAATVEAREVGNGAGGDGGVGSGAAAPPTPTPATEGAVPEIKIFIESPGAGSSGTNNDSAVLCKICHDEGPESEMETPCACDGTIKFAHRLCVQKWIDQKGDIICEICHKEYRPDYSVHPKANGWFGNTENGEIINRGVRFLNSAGIIMMLLLSFRYILMLAVDIGVIPDSSWYINKYIDFAGFLLPGYAFIRTLFLIRWREWFWCLE